MAVVLTLFGAFVSFGLMAVASIFYGAMALEVRNPMLMTPITILLYLGIFVGSIYGARRTSGRPFIQGMLIGCILAALVCGICSTGVAVDSKNGLNIH